MLFSPAGFLYNADQLLFIQGGRPVGELYSDLPDPLSNTPVYAGSSWGEIDGRVVGTGFLRDHDSAVFRLF